MALAASDHQSPPDFERQWQQIQVRTAAQSPLGRQVIAGDSGHYIHDDHPELVLKRIRELLQHLRSEVG